MSAVTKFLVDKLQPQCGEMIQMDVTATFQSAEGGTISVTVDGANDCYFELDKGDLAKHLARTVSGPVGIATFYRSLRCKSLGNTALDLIATATDGQGTSVPRRQSIMVKC